MKRTYVRQGFEAMRIDLPKTLYRRLKRAAFERDVRMVEIIREGIRRELDRIAKRRSKSR